MSSDQVFPRMDATEFGEDPTPEYPCVPEQFSPVGGLTKRELFAAMAMQGVMSSDFLQKGLDRGVDVLARSTVAAVSVQLADALIAELAK